VRRPLPPAYRRLFAPRRAVSLTLATFLGRFSTRRMLGEYAAQVYQLPGFEVPAQAVAS